MNCNSLFKMLEPPERLCLERCALRVNVKVLLAFFYREICLAPNSEISLKASSYSQMIFLHLLNLVTPPAPE